MRPHRLTVPIFAELREFLTTVDCIAENLESGAWRFEDNPDGVFYWDDTAWRKEGVMFRDDFYGNLEEPSGMFHIECHPDLGYGRTEWQFSFTREEIARIAAGQMTSVALYACAHPRCGFRSSDEFERCPHCRGDCRD